MNARVCLGCVFIFIFMGIGIDIRRTNMAPLCSVICTLRGSNDLMTVVHGNEWQKRTYNSLKRCLEVCEYIISRFKVQHLEYNFDWEYRCSAS